MTRKERIAEARSLLLTCKQLEGWDGTPDECRAARAKYAAAIAVIRRLEPGQQQLFSEQPRPLITIVEV